MPRKTDPPEELTPEQRARLRVWLKAKHPKLLHDSRELWEECRDHHLSHGKQRVNWEATYRNWVRTHLKFEKRDHRKRNPQPGDAEMPQEQGPREGDMVKLDLVWGGKK